MDDNRHAEQGQCLQRTLTSVSLSSQTGVTLSAEEHTHISTHSQRPVSEHTHQTKQLSISEGSEALLAQRRHFLKH